MEYIRLPLILLIISLFMIIFPCYSQQRDQNHFNTDAGMTGYVSHTFSGNKLFVFTEDNAFSFAPYGDEMLRIGFHFGQDTAYPASLPIVMDPMGSADVEEEGKFLYYRTSLYEVIIQKNPINYTIVNDGDTLLWECSSWDEGQGSVMRFSAEPGAAWYGGGSRAIPINRSEMELYMLNEAFYGYGWGTERMNISIPMAVCSGGFALYFETAVPGSMDLGIWQPGQIGYTASSGPLSCFVIRPADPDSLMAPFTTLTGRQPLPPLWALGYIQSRFGYENEAEAYEVVEQMIAQGFPMDAIIFDLQWQGGVGLMGNLVWDTGRFPDPQGMMQDFEELGVKSVCIADPYFTKISLNYPTLAAIGWLAKTQAGLPYVLEDFWAGPSGLFDVTIPIAQDWFWQRCRQQMTKGVAGWWTDLGEPEKAPDDMVFSAGTSHEIRQTYNLRWSKFLYEHFRQEYPDRRLFNLTRSGYAGMQRYSTFPWSGDVQKSFGGMRAQVPVMLGMGLCGVGYMHADIGGFTGFLHPELYTRWQQMGVFTPVMRAHGTGVVTEPIYFEEPYKSIVREFIRLRYRMLPYNYSLAYENSISGMPLVRPLFFEDPNQRDIDDQYLWGKDLMIAPVMEEGAVSRQVIFPEGKWIDFFRWTEYQGESTIEIYAPLDQLPVYARAGAVIAMLPDIQNTLEYNSGQYHVRYFADPEVANSSAQIYMDDGQSWQASNENKFILIRLTATYLGEQSQIFMERQGEGFADEPLDKEMMFEIVRAKDMPDLVTFNEEQLVLTTEENVYQSQQSAALYLEDESRLLVKVLWDSETPGLIRIEGLEISTSFSVPEKRIMDITIYPNPLKADGQVGITVSREGRYQFQLFNSLGQQIGCYARYYPSAGYYSHSWRDLFPGHIPGGKYILKISDSKGAMEPMKIVILN